MEGTFNVITWLEQFIQIHSIITIKQHAKHKQTQKLPDFAAKRTSSNNPD